MMKNRRALGLAEPRPEKTFEPSATQAHPMQGRAIVLHTNELMGISLESLVY
jgi:hypothetical protein